MKKKIFNILWYWNCILSCILTITAPQAVIAKNKCSTFVTNINVQDGFGSQFQNIIASVFYAEANNVPFFYTPFTSMEHNYHNDPDFLQKKEHLINFLGNFELSTDVKCDLKINSAKDFMDKNIQLFESSNTIRKIKEIFRSNKNREDFFSSEQFHIAVHIRRPNPHDSRIEGTNMADELFLEIINSLRNVYKEKKPIFHIFSQGNLDQFNAFIQPDIKLHLNDDIEFTFSAMVLADALVTSPSSLSYTAALISNGDIYYSPFWHSPLSSWVSNEELLLNKRGPADKDENQETSIRAILPKSLTFDNKTGKIIIPEYIKHIKLDIGLSYSAPMSQHWLMEEQNLWVFGFEPNQRSAESILNGASKILPSHGEPLEKRFINERFFLIPCALGISSDHMMPFFVTADCGCCSLYKPKELELEKMIQVPVFNLEDFFNIFPFDTHPVIDYIKIDAQGADLDIVKSAGKYLAQRIVFITVEAENDAYENTHNSSQEIDNYLYSQGFQRYTSALTGDPTYINLNFVDYARDNSIIIYQQG